MQALSLNWTKRVSILSFPHPISLDAIPLVAFVGEIGGWLHSHCVSCIITALFPSDSFALKLFPSLTQVATDGALRKPEIKSR